MTLLRKYLALPAKDKGLILGVVPLVVAVRVALATLPYKVVVGWLERFQTPPAQEDLGPAEQEALRVRRRRILMAVEVVSRHLLGEKPCLTQALVAQCLLRRTGYETTLRIGVSKDERVFRAHAWLEQGGRVVIGGGASPIRYRPLHPVQPDVS